MEGVSRISTVIFDLGGVIVPLDFPRGYAALGRLSACGPEEMRERIAATGLVERLERGQVQPEAFARVICRSLGIDVAFEEFCELWGSIFPPETLVAEDLLESIAGQCRLLLLSNTNGIHFPYIQRNYGLLRHFHDFVLSYRVGVMKPAPEIYVEALKRAGCPPGECFFTDDLESNVAAARELGLAAVRFENEAQIREDLRARGLWV